MINYEKMNGETDHFAHFKKGKNLFFCQTMVEKNNWGYKARTAHQTKLEYPTVFQSHHAKTSKNELYELQTGLSLKIRCHWDILLDIAEEWLLRTTNEKKMLGISV